MFFKLIYDTLDELNKAAGGQYIQWTEVDEDDAIHIKRYIVFMLEKYECEQTAPSDRGGFYLPLSNLPECNATNLRNLLTGLDKFLMIIL
uniref:Uncharacterized protein n=1 Tax=Panagrolaimus davidi TaxID=227884 RepID=A0A914QTW2_9BILA